MVGSVDEEERMDMSSLCLLSYPVHSPDHDDTNSGCSTPTFHISASVPFKWEEEPGKRIPCTALIHFTQPISLQLTPPPRMTSLVNSEKVTKTPSPITVFDGPALSPERGLLGQMVMNDVKKKLGRRLFGSWFWRRKCKGSSEMVSMRDGFGGSFVFASSASFEDGIECCSEYGGESERVSEQVNVTKMKKSKIFFSLTQVMPWKGNKLKKDGALRK